MNRPNRPVEILSRLRVIVADDERPAREFLLSLLRACADVEIVGDAATGTEAVDLIERVRPDLALLDLQMPELDGLGVIRMLRRDRMPLVAFVTAYDQYAVTAFEANAIDYLLKPVEATRLRQTIARAHERLDRAEFHAADADRLKAVATEIDVANSPAGFLRRIPIRRRDDIVILPVEQIAAVVADGELLRLTTVAGDRHTITYRLKDLESRLDPSRFIRLSRGTIANVDLIHRISPMPGGTYVVTLKNNLQLPVSRLRARVLREELFRL